MGIGELEWYERGIEYCLLRSGCHFLLGFWVAWSLYLLTSTILLRGRSVLRMDESSIHIISVLLAVSFAVVLHILEDYLLKKF